MAVTVVAVAMDCTVKAVVATEGVVVATKEGVAIHRVKEAATAEEEVAATEVVSVREEATAGEAASAATATTSDSLSTP